MGTQEQVQSGPTFDRRYYEALRVQKLAPDIGRVAFEGLNRRLYEEITSGLAEALPGVIRTNYSFELKEGKIVAADGQNIEELLLNGRENDKQLSEKDDFYKGFLVQRSAHELEEFYEQEAMANGETSYNTIITFSPYSEEFDSPQTRRKLTNAAQKPYWQRGMLRVSHWDGEHLHVSTRSIDNSSVALFKKVAKEHLDYTFEAKDSTAMLGERIRWNIIDEPSSSLADSIVGTADKILVEQNGGVWKQGRSKDKSEDLQKFVESESQVIESLIKMGKSLAEQSPTFEIYKDAFDEQMYDHISLLEKRLELGVQEKITDMQAATGAAGNMARAEGRVYDMCGNVLGVTNTSTQTANQLGSESLKRLANKKVECPECKNKVVVANKDLEAGLLYCKDCDYGVDVCTGKKFSRGIKHPQKPKLPDFFEVISADLARFDQQRKQKHAEKNHDFNIAA